MSANDISKNGKSNRRRFLNVSISSVAFLNEYPFFRRAILNLLEIALDNQPTMKVRWAEILVHNNKKLVARAQKELSEGQTLREHRTYL